MELPHREKTKHSHETQQASHLKAKRITDVHHVLRFPSISACAFRFRKPFWNTVAFLSWARSWKGLLFERRDASWSESCSSVIEVNNSFSSLDEQKKKKKRSRGLEDRGNINLLRELMKTVIKDGLTLPTQAGGSWLSYKETVKHV